MTSYVWLITNLSISLCATNCLTLIKVCCDCVLDDSDLDRVFRLPPITFIGGNEQELPLREIISRLEVCMTPSLTDTLLSTLSGYMLSSRLLWEGNLNLNWVFSSLKQKPLVDNLIPRVPKKEPVLQSWFLTNWELAHRSIDLQSNASVWYKDQQRNQHKRNIGVDCCDVELSVVF